MKKAFIVAVISITGFSTSSFADEPSPIACVISAENEAIDCPLTDVTDAPVVDEPPVCTDEDMSACQRGPIMYNKGVDAPIPTSIPEKESSNILTLFFALFSVAAVFMCAVLLRKISDLNDKQGA